MFRKGKSQERNTSNRASRIARVVAVLIRMREKGIVVDEAEIGCRFATLMPELLDSLRLAKGVQAAAERAHQNDRRDEPEEVLGGLSADELALLSSALPEYQFLESLSRGGQGAVYRAVQTSVNRVVAIKVLLDGPMSSQRQRQRFAREADLISRLRHPNIVTLYESGVVRGRQFFAMEFVDGLPIDDYVLLHQPDVDTRVRLLLRVCRAVSYAHQRGVIHRDLKPANILVDLDGEPHILDFGLAKSAENAVDGGFTQHLSLTGQVLGTLPYMSPEQASGAHDEIDVRSDIYSLGVVLYRVLTWTFPYPVTGDPITIRSNILSKEPQSLRQAVAARGDEFHSASYRLGDDLERIVLKALAKDKARRYQSAAALADDLERYLAGDVVEAKADSSYYILRKSLRKYRAQVAVVASFGLILAVSSILITVLWLQARSERDNARQVALLAHSTLDNVVTEIEDSVRHLAGGTEVRDKLLGQVNQRYELLSPFVESDIELDELLLALREKQGDIAFAQGRHNEAQRYYRDFLRISQERSSGGVSSCLARAHRKLAGVATESEMHFLQAIDLGKSLIAGASPSEGDAKELCVGNLAFGQWLYDNGRYAEAFDQTRAAVALAEEHSESEGESEEWKENLATAYGLMGRVQRMLGSEPSGLKMLDAGLQLRVQMSQAQPANVLLRQKLLVSYINVGKAYRDTGRLGLASEMFQEAVSIGTYLTRVDPAATAWKRDQYSAHDCLARVLLDAGDHAGARVHCELAMDAASQLVQAEPDNTEWRRILAFSYYLCGRVVMSREGFGAASDIFKRAADLQRQITLEESENLAVKSELARTLDMLGSCARGLGDVQQAKEYYMNALAVRRELAQRNPGTTKYALDTIVSLTKLAAWHIEEDTAQGDNAASEYLGRAATSLAALRESGELEGHESIGAALDHVIHRNCDLISARHAARESVTDRSTHAGTSEGLNTGLAVSTEDEPQSDSMAVGD